MGAGWRSFRGGGEYGCSDARSGVLPPLCSPRRRRPSAAARSPSSLPALRLRWLMAPLALRLKNQTHPFEIAHRCIRILYLLLLRWRGGTCGAGDAQRGDCGQAAGERGFHGGGGNSGLGRSWPERRSSCSSKNAETQRRSEDSRQIAATCGARVIAFALFSAASLRLRV